MWTRATRPGKRDDNAVSALPEANHVPRRTSIKVARLLALSGFGLWQGPVLASTGLSAGSPSVALAVAWLQDTLLGTVATLIAIIAVASIGFVMLTGRLRLRQGATIVLGCFIVMGARTIAAGVLAAARGGATAEAVGYVPPSPPPAPSRPPPPPSPPQADPFAGASVPTR